MTIEVLSPAGVRQLIIAGWTGRDRAAQDKHIAELELLGVTRPATTPVYYLAAACRLTTADFIEVTGNDSSGEVEFVVLKINGSLWIAVGSDHTDRKVETYNITTSKQMCDKPISGDMWLLDDLIDHWDTLVLRSWRVTANGRHLYQEGKVSAMLHPQELIAGYEGGDGGPFEEGFAMFGGTLAAFGGIQPANRFEFELEDGVLQRRLVHGYDVRVLPNVG
jgi:hypothetical protein